MKKIGTAVVIAILGMTLFAQGALAQSVRILYERDDYALGQFEPDQGVYLGAYILQDVTIGGDPQVFNEITGKKHASFFRYVGYGRMVPEYWMEMIREAEAAPHIALEPNQGLDVVQDDLYLRSLARQLAQVEGPVFLRYASEMNGDWAAYSGDPELYIEKWRLVHDVMKEEAPNVMMVWTVFTFPQNSILWYYPGDEYVDWVGVNIYNVVYHNNNLSQRAEHQDPLELLDYVYDTFSHRKPIQISEYGATQYTTTDERSYVDFAVEKITRLYSGLAEKYPRVKSIFYFNTNNLVNAPLGRRINDYSLTSSDTVLLAYRDVVSTDHYLSEIGPDQAGILVAQLFHMRSGFFMENGTTYISSSVLPEYFSLRVNWDRQVLSLEDGQILGFDRSRVLLREGRSHFPIRYLAELLGYQVQFQPQNRLITLRLNREYPESPETAEGTVGDEKDARTGLVPGAGSGTVTEIMRRDNKGNSDEFMGTGRNSDDFLPVLS